MALQGKIAVRDGRVFFASGMYLSTEEGTYFTRFWRLDCPAPNVKDGELASSADGTVRVFGRGFGVRAEWRICNPDGSAGGGGSPAAFTEDTKIPRPKVRAGVDVRWSHAGWQKYSRKERDWVPA